MRYIMSFALLATFVFPSYTRAQANHADKNGRPADHHLEMCADFLPKEKAGIPDFTRSNWVAVNTLDAGFFRFVFYFDTERPGLPIAAMTVAFPQKDPAITRVTWQVGDLMRTVRLGVEEMVCEKSVVAADGNRYELAEIMMRLAESQAKSQPEKETK